MTLKNQRRNNEDTISDQKADDISAFDFDLPAENIAHHPVHPRERARLLNVVCSDDDTSIKSYLVGDLPEILRPDDLLVFNNTKVLPAKLYGARIRDNQSASIGITLDRALADGCWKALIKNSKRLKQGDIIHFPMKHYSDINPDDPFHSVTATVEELFDGGEAALRFSVNDERFTSFLHDIGELALPPYIKREHGPLEEDEKDYQTIFAKIEGAVAAPTASLHFTDNLLDKLAQRGIKHCFVTLHVGAGTFLPVRDTIENHVMHAEWGEITPEVAKQINEARKQGRRIIPVGTTSLRLIESATDEDGTTKPWIGETDIFIRPGHYTFKGIDALITNFHLPKSTLFMLVSALMGTSVMHKAYDFAIKNKMRFYSYGDACLLEPNY